MLAVFSWILQMHLIQLIIAYCLKKLEHYGIRGVPNKWFTSCLNNRYDAVKIKVNFQRKKLLHEVSHLGSVLFLLYINDIKNSRKY